MGYQGMDRFLCSQSFPGTIYRYLAVFLKTGYPHDAPIEYFVMMVGIFILQLYGYVDNYMIFHQNRYV